jgi:hypothetical protein
MRRRLLSLLAALGAALSILTLSGCTLDPITQTRAGFVMYADAGKSYVTAYSVIALPTFTCLPKATSTVRYYTAVDGLPGAANQVASARLGVIMGCVNGSPSYVPFYGVYEPGRSSPDRSFAPVRLLANDILILQINVGPLPGQLWFEMSPFDESATRNPGWSGFVRMFNTPITGTATGCLWDAPAGTYALPKTPQFFVYGCETRTDMSLSGMYWALDGKQRIRSFNVTTKSGKPLTTLLRGGYNGVAPIFSIVER